MTDRAFDALRAAVTLAKSYQIKNLSALKYKLRLLGFTQAEISEALTVWANRVRNSNA